MSHDMTKPTCGCAPSEDSDQPVWSVFAVHMNKPWVLSYPPERTAKTLIRLGGCPGWSEFLLGAQSFCWFCHIAVQTAILSVALVPSNSLFGSFSSKVSSSLADFRILASAYFTRHTSRLFRKPYSPISFNSWSRRSFSKGRLGVVNVLCWTSLTLTIVSYLACKMKWPIFVTKTKKKKKKRALQALHDTRQGAYFCCCTCSMYMYLPDLIKSTKYFTRYWA